MDHKWKVFIAGAVLAGLTIPIHSQPSHAQQGGELSEAPPESGTGVDEAIIVTGVRETDSAEIREFVDAIVAETGNDRVARWDDRICLNVEGVSAAQENYIVRKVATVATELRLRIAQRASCGPAAYVIFTDEPETMLARIEESRPRLLGPDKTLAMKDFRSSTAPVRWLSAAEMRGADGQTPMSFYVDPKTGGVERPVPAVKAVASRLQTGSRMDIQSMFVLVDTSKLEGISNRSLAAYLSMIVLGNVRQGHEDVRHPSILRLFDARFQEEGVATIDLTNWDMSYLKSLYSGTWNMAASHKIAAIQSTMDEDLNEQRVRRGSK